MAHRSMTRYTFPASAPILHRMKAGRVLLTGMAAVIVAGTFASASPLSVSAPTPEASVALSPSPSESPEPGDTTSAEVSTSVSESPEPEDMPSAVASPSESPESEPTPSADPAEPDPGRPDDATSEDGSDPGLDFSACVGLMGLENAICRHEALLAIHPGNKGLQNSLSHLEANLAKQESHTPPGQSGKSHGQSED